MALVHGPLFHRFALDVLCMNSRHAVTSTVMTDNRIASVGDFFTISPFSVVFVPRMSMACTASVSILLRKSSLVQVLRLPDSGDAGEALRRNCGKTVTHPKIRQ